MSRVAPRVAVAIVATAVPIAAVAPLAVVLGAGRLLVTVLLVVGAWATVGRARVPDLGAGLPVALGAAVGGVTPTVLGLPPLLGPLLAVTVGALAGAASVAMLTRTGRIRGALATLVLTAAAPALLTAWPGVGGEPGFHAVPLVTGSDRLDLPLVASVLAVAAGAVVAVAESRHGALAAVSLRAPEAAEALGVPAWRGALPLGLVGGASLGLTGWAVAVLGGSVLPAAYGLPLAGLAVVGAVLAGARAWAAPVAGLLLALPGVLWPLAPVVGDAPPLLTTGAVALLVVLRLGALTRQPEPSDPAALPDPAPTTGLRLEVRDVVLPDGRTVDLDVAPGEIVHLRGPNGVGKSTLLAVVGGQLPDRGRVRLDGRPAPRGPVARAALGVARTWQRTPDVRAADLLHAVGVGGGGGADRAQVAAALAHAPRLLLLDEPSAHLGVGGTADALARARAAGVSVLVVEHTELHGVDRVVTLEPTREGAS